MKCACQTTPERSSVTIERLKTKLFADEISAAITFFGISVGWAMRIVLGVQPNVGRTLMNIPMISFIIYI